MQAGVPQPGGWSPLREAQAGAWVPDLTAHGDVEPHPGPANAATPTTGWGAIRDEVAFRVGPRTRIAKKRLEEALDAFEESMYDHYPDAPLLTDENVRSFLAEQREFPALQQNLIPVIEDIVNAAVSSQASSVPSESFSASSHSTYPHSMQGAQLSLSHAPHPTLGMAPMGAAPSHHQQQQQQQYFSPASAPPVGAAPMPPGPHHDQQSPPPMSARGRSVEPIPTTAYPMSPQLPDGAYPMSQEYPMPGGVYPISHSMSDDLVPSSHPLLSSGLSSHGSMMGGGPGPTPMVEMKHNANSYHAHQQPQYMQQQPHYDAQQPMYDNGATAQQHYQPQQQAQRLPLYEKGAVVAVLRSNKEWDEGWLVESTAYPGEELTVSKIVGLNKLTKVIAAQNVSILVRPGQPLPEESKEQSAASQEKRKNSSKAKGAKEDKKKKGKRQHGTAYAQTLEEIKAEKEDERQKKLDEVLAKKKAQLNQQSNAPAAGGAQSARSSKRPSMKSSSSSSGKSKRSSAPNVDTNLGGLPLPGPPPTPPPTDGAFSSGESTPKNAVAAQQGRSRSTSNLSTHSGISQVEPVVSTTPPADAPQHDPPLPPIGESANGIAPPAVPPEALPAGGDDETAENEERLRAAKAKRDEEENRALEERKARVRKYDIESINRPPIEYVDPLKDFSGVGGGRGGIGAIGLSDMWLQKVKANQEKKREREALERANTYKDACAGVDVAERRSKIDQAIKGLRSNLGERMTRVPVRMVLRQKVDLPGAYEFIGHLSKGMAVKVERFEVDEAQFKEGPVLEFNLYVRHDPENPASAGKIIRSINKEVKSLLDADEGLLSGGTFHNLARVEPGEQAPIDVVFVLDCSSSVRRGLDQLRQFVTSVVEYLMAGQEGASMNTRIGIIVYAKRVYKLFELGDPNCCSLDQMVRKIQDIAVVGGGTNTAGAIEAAIQFHTSATYKIMIVVTDGEHNRGRPPWEVADEARNDGWQVMAIGVKDASNDEIQKIGDNALYFKCESYNQVLEAMTDFAKHGDENTQMYE